MVKKNYFRKVAFGLKPGQDIPKDPVAWAQKQVEKVPPLSWKGEIPSQQHYLDQFAKYRIEQENIRKKYSDNISQYKKAYDNLKNETGHGFYHYLELVIRHDAAINNGSPVFERLVWFWANHFAALDKDSLPWTGLTGEYHRTIIRQNLVKNFTDLTKAVTTSYAMIQSLDNSESIGPNSEEGKWKRKKGQLATVNENHARELLELHTVSPKAGYSQKDVVALSYIMAGWQIPWTKTRDTANPVKFNRKRHQPGDHKVMGKKYKQKGLSPKNKLLDVIPDLCAHPSCREFIAYKLCRHFICDEPTVEMTKPIVDAWTKSKGNLPDVHKALLKVAYTYADQYQKFHSPEVWFVHLANMFGIKYPVNADLMKYDYKAYPNQTQRMTGTILNEIGHNPFRPAQPNGWPDTEAEWISPELILRRFQFSNRLFRFPLYEARKKNGADFEAAIKLNFDEHEIILKKIDHKKLSNGNGLGEDKYTAAVELLATSKWGMYA